MASHTTIGSRKTSNQDAHCFLVADSAYGEIAFAAIADGVGGLSQGELASSTVISRFAEWFEVECPRFLAENADAGSVDLTGLEYEWRELLLRLNGDIRRHGMKAGAHLGTTFTGVLICQGRYFVAHVGDCRAYRFSARGFDVLTRDQTLAAREVEQGVLTPEQAVGHEHDNVLLQAVGTQEGLAPDFASGKTAPDDLFVLCCDGFYRSLPEPSLVGGFSRLRGAGEAQMKSECERLVQESISAGSSDNVTVMCFACVPGGVDADDAATSVLSSGGSNGVDESTSVLSPSADEATSVLVPPDDEATGVLASSDDEATGVLVPSGATSQEIGSERGLGA